MITSFEGENAFLSNFFPSPITFLRETWPTAEHFFQSRKTLSPLERGAIRLATTPGRAKRLGRTVTMRGDWESIKIDVMEFVVASKFDQNPELRTLLLATGEQELIEGNNWKDFFWGVCDGKGENHLGKILMKVRKELKDAD